MTTLTRRQEGAARASAARAARVAAAQLELCRQALRDPDSLPPLLREVAELRVAHPDMNQRQLGTLLDPPLTDYGVMDRMRRLERLLGVAPRTPNKPKPPEPAASLAGLVGNAPEWQERALCAQTDPEAFFPEKGGSTRDAKRICSMCEVRPECLAWALEKDERFGVYGGLSERERRKLKRRGGG